MSSLFTINQGKAGGAMASGAVGLIPSGRRRWLAACVAACCILLLTGWQVWSGYREAIDDMTLLSTALTRVSEEHVTGIVRGIDIVLTEMAEMVPDDGVVDPERFRSLLSSRMKQFSFVRNAFLTDTKGSVLLGTLPGMTGLDLHDRAHFIVPVREPFRRMYISEPLQSRAQNAVSIFVTRAIRNSAGTVLGVVGIAVDPALFDDMLRSVAPAPGGRATLIRDDGVVLARAPESEGWRGRSLADSEVMQAIAAGSPSGVSVGVAMTDGVERVISYRKFATYPLVVAVGMATGPSLRSWRANALSHAGVAAALVLVLLGLAMTSGRRQAERQRVQAALAASETRFRLLSDRSPVGIVQADAIGHCLYANDRWVELTGRGRDALVGRKWCDVVAAEDRVGVAESWAGLARDGGEVSEEMRIRTPDGSIRWVRGHASSLSGVGGEAGLVVTFEDITAARDSSQKLALSEEKFAKAFRGSPDALVISTAADGAYVEVNNAFCRLLGYRRAEFMGADAKTLGVWVNPEDRERLVAIVAREGQIEDFETVLRRKDGKTMIVLVSVQQIVVAGESCLLFICRDISERREMEARTQVLLAQLDASNKELEQFAYVTSHDLQEPLRMIAGYAQLIERRYHGRLDSDADEFIGFLVDGAKRMQGMILDLLDYSRVDRRGGTFEEFDGTAALEDVRLNLLGSVNEANGRVEIGPMPVVVADRSQFVRLFQNLIGNALKYRHPDRVPEITVSAERDDGAWVFSVADNGIGIGSEYFERIFQVFQRLHTRDKYEGSGIGLAICKKIVERHGGRVWVRSESGLGCVFQFTLPIRPAGPDTTES